MIKANELRIGNWLKTARSGVPYQVTPEVIASCIRSNEGFNLWESPIKLTEDIVKKMGFVPIGNSRWMVNYGKNGCAFLKWHNGYDRFVWCLSEHHNVVIDYVHELQNIFFTNTKGNELTYEP